ncbi:MAG: phosphatidylcholine/phosphatidylserine synthase [Candidatus Acidiferrales bacterium]
MRDTEQRELGFDGRIRNQQRLRRGIYLLPSAFTVANMMCGFYAVIAVLKGGPADLDYAARAIGFAIVFDVFDGFVARATHTNTDFGKQFDSLADMVSFGIAPATLAYAWGAHGMLTSDAPQARHIYQLAWFISLFFVICCAWRLARFNVHGMAPGGSRFFVGLPTPAAAGLVAATVHAVRGPIDDWHWAGAWLALVFVAAALMVSAVRYRSFKDVPWARRQPSLTIVLIASLIGAIVVYSEIVLILLASVYVFSGVALHVVRVTRQRFVSHPSRPVV